MKNKRPSVNLNQDELDFIFRSGYSIHSTWISPMEGVEFRVVRLGGEDVLAYRKSERACYNFIKRRVAPHPASADAPQPPG